MQAVKLDLQSALQQAQGWLKYEGIVRVRASRTPNGDALVVVTNCNPAAITAPVPSYFQGFPVIFCQIQA
ncbi:MAG: hypothetical protein CMK83_19665 [Pseudomonadales bacterium]|jgi:hypothetical protein|nr:hypothetical protein [Pseudomonadales bacterium]TNC85499.1 MAG: hypothetical protein CSH49_17725 [Alcanivorax sp.]HAG93097.1 hypothetical protein [Gammaproteobacteria bacterium]MAQ26431.1 hypothetical protein [Pseudomonadales bacterium]HAU12189.1 hypothetical protein [Gammaproteobacteria bacterium]|tara:strand:+ start:6743 stop:6952 length:210 start_codon:yes stop_codon:yes gene_type:complete